MGEVGISDLCCNHAYRQRCGAQKVLRYLHFFSYNKIFELYTHLFFEKAGEIVGIQVELLCNFCTTNVPFDMILNVLNNLFHLPLRIFV